MSNSLFFDFSVDKQAHVITVKREFAAPVKSVWRAWTTPEIIDQWWAAEGWKSKSKSMEFRPGGQRHYLMTGPAGEAMWGLTTYLHIDAHQRFSGKESFVDENAVVNTALPQSEYAIEFIDKGDHTLIEHCTTFQSLEALEESLKYGFEKGTLDAYARLDEVLNRK